MNTVDQQEGDICFSLAALPGYLAFPGDRRSVPSNGMPDCHTKPSPPPAIKALEERGDICGSLIALPGYIVFPE